ncbi:MAG TPA: hypothetical protein VF648_05865 [Pyrinomonadaceae bacterium]|jgi:hypothetical protein
MQRNTKQSKKKQQDTVQIVSGEHDAKTPQKKPSKSSRRSRAKFECPSNLEFLIWRANLLPADFEFDWENEVRAGGTLGAIEKWKQVYSRLPKQTQHYLFAASTSPLNELRKELLEYYNLSFQTEEPAPFDPAPLALLQLNELLEIRELLMSVVQLYTAMEVSIKTDYVSFNPLDSSKLVNYLLAGLYKKSDHSSSDFIEQNCSEKLKEFPPLLQNCLILNEKSSYIIYGLLQHIRFTKEETDEALLFLETFSDQYIIYMIAYKHLLLWRQYWADQFEYSLDEDSSFKQYKMTTYLDGIEEIYKCVITVKDYPIGKSGINPEFSRYAKELQGVDVSRVRSCEICGKFFWAARKDAVACSKKHSKTRRMRLLRQHWKESGELYLEARKKKNQNPPLE